MSKLVWDKIGERFYETGVDHAVLYPLSAAGVYDRGVAWNGITGITESPSGAEPNNMYADNIKYLELVGGTKGSVALDEDKNIVLLIKNNSQSVKVISTKDSSSVTKIYTLTGLTLES